MWCQTEHPEHRPHVMIPQMFSPGSGDEKPEMPPEAMCLTYLAEHHGWTWCEPPEERKEGTPLTKEEEDKYFSDLATVASRFGIKL